VIFVDTNFFLRFLLEDIDSQSQEAKKLFLAGAQGREKLLTSTIVFFEIYWVLKTSIAKSQLAGILTKVLAMNFIIFDEYSRLVDSLDLFRNSNLSLEDCYNLAYAKEKNIKSFKTFDTKLSKFFEKN